MVLWGRMNKDAIRLVFSFFAAAVTLGMAQEWATWAIEDRRWWKLGPATVLGAFAMFEAHQVWRRVERLLRLNVVQ